MGHEIHQRRKALSIGEQIGRMSKYPQLEATLRRNIVEWIGPWSPSALSDTYLISVSYQFLCRPKVSILSPDLKLAAGKKKLPHVYKAGQRDLCLHLRWEWSPRLFIADTILPWASQWIAFYETWVQTGCWLGKGTHPDWPQHAEVR